MLATYPTPQEYPKPQEKTGSNWKDDGDKEVDEEGEEGPGDEGDDHHDQQDHVRAEPGNEERSTVQHCAKEEEKGEEDMENPGEDEAAEQRLVVFVQPAEATADCLGDLHAIIR